MTTLDDAIRDDPRYRPAVSRTRRLLAERGLTTDEWDRRVWRIVRWAELVQPDQAARREPVDA